MMVANRGSTFGLLLWQWPKVVVFTLAATLTVVLYDVVGWTAIKLPAVPIGVVGGALGIFVSFRTNSAYDRWWEGRKLWGRLINTSRHLATQAQAYLPDDRDSERAIIRRQIAYVHSLRVLLRANKARPESRKGSADRVEDDPHVQRYLSETERQMLARESNPTHALLNHQLAQLTELRRDATIDHYQLQDFDSSIRHLLDIQGGCERINKTPMPRGYGFIAERLIVAFSLLFPAVVVADLSWAAVPISVLVCLAFALISEAGRVLEDPFTEFWNGLPLDAMSITIERNLLHSLGDTEVPPAPKPDDSGVLL
jgi:putative membrane protein